MSKKNYKDLEKEMRALYKSLRKIYCPCLKEYIIFNSKGFHHLKYDGSNKTRTISNQMYRMGLIPLIPTVIKNATEIDKYVPKCYKKAIGKYVEYWSIKTMAGKQKSTIKIILRRIGDGNITFYSIMKKRDKPKKIKKPLK